MKDKLINALGNIDDKYIIEAHTENRKGISISFSLRQIGKAALVGLCLILTFTAVSNMRSPLKSLDSSESVSEIENGYYGLVFEDSMSETNDVLTKDSEDQTSKLIVSGSMSLETKTFDETINLITEYVKDNGGYIQSSWVNNDYNRYYESVIRIPAEHYSDFTDLLRKVGNCTHYSETTDDITAKYYDVDARINSLTQEEERVIEFYNKANNINELMEVEERLTEIRSEIDSLETKMKNWDLLAEYSTLNLEIYETKLYTETSESFLNKINSAFAGGYRNFIMAVEDVILTFIYNIWLIVTVIAAGFTAFIIYRKYHKK